LYDNGQGVSKNRLEAAKWYRKAADQGYTNSQVNLGTMYANGQGVPRNHVTAYFWWSLAAANGYKQAAGFLKTLEKRMIPAQIAEAREMAAKWRPKKATSAK
jgi:hypothetical protein